VAFSAARNGELAVRFQAGGLYAYLVKIWTWLFFRWMALLVMDPGLTAAIATGAAGIGYGLPVDQQISWWRLPRLSFSRCQYSW
jgi:hypothetical protein